MKHIDKFSQFSSLTPDKSYDELCDIIESELDIFRRAIYIKIKSIVEEKSLSYGEDISNTQYGMSTPNENFEISKEFEKFTDFVNRLEDDYKIYLYFTVENGKFRWLGNM
jgi:hypothetical protein